MMNIKKCKKIFIVGIYGSGKSTLAKKLASLLHLRIYELDDLKYKRKYDIIRTVKERLKLLDKTTKGKSWIVEGAWTSYAVPVYQRADLVILLNIARWKLYHRIITRHFKRKLSGEKRYKDNLRSMFKMLKKINTYYRDSTNYLSLGKHMEYINRYASKVVVLRNNKEIKRFIEGLK